MNSGAGEFRLVSKLKVYRVAGDDMCVNIAHHTTHTAIGICYNRTELRDADSIMYNA